MEKKNTILLTVIAVATLLVAVVGATFAYFTAATNADGTGNVNTGNANTLGSIDLQLANIDVEDNIAYPGGMMVNAASVTATVTGSGTFNATYTINASVDASNLNSENTTVTYALYRLETPVVGDLIKADSCKLQTGTADTEEPGQTVQTYYYTGCAANDSITGDPIKKGTITISSGTKTASFSVDDQTFTGVTSAAADTVYYYLVVNYVNNDSAEQNDDMGGSITAQITSITNATSNANNATAGN